MTRPDFATGMGSDEGRVATTRAQLATSGVVFVAAGAFREDTFASELHMQSLRLNGTYDVSAPSKVTLYVTISPWAYLFGSKTTISL